MIRNRDHIRRAIRAGDRVVVREFDQIAATLDLSGALDGLPFISEMRKYCGHSFVVRHEVHKLIQEGVGSSMRRIKDVVLLDGPVCDGHAHGDCRRACFPLWKTDWLDLVQVDSPRAGEGELTIDARRPTCQRQAAEAGPAGGEETISGSGLSPEEPNRRNICQVTELMRATKPLPLWHPVRYIIDIKAKTYSPREYIGYLTKGIYKKTLRHILSRPERYNAPAVAKSLVPPGYIDLKPGDLVEVRSIGEIRSTLDAEGRARGLYFMPVMWSYCGRVFRVHQTVDRMISEKTGDLRDLKQTVILEGVTCDGKAHGGCQRSCYVFWKSSWLKPAVK